MTLNQATQRKVYDRLRAHDGLELADNSPVTGSIASVLSEGEVLADNGEQYDSIQDAVDASDGWTFVGPGTYYEDITFSTDGFTLVGAGRGTEIRQREGFQIGGSNITLDSLRFEKAPGEQYNFNCRINADDSVIKNSVFNAPTNEYQDLVVAGRDVVIDDCYFSSAGYTVSIGQIRAIVKDCTFNITEDTGSDFARAIITTADDCIFVNNNISIVGVGIQINGANDCLIGGNRIHHPADDPSGTSDGSIVLTGSGNNCIVFNNRVSGSDAIRDSHTGTLLDANSTGAAN